jgi:hypothetical protein
MEVLMTTAQVVAPRVAFYEKSTGSYVDWGGQWRRATSEDLARMHTGRAVESRELHVGVYVCRRPNGLVRIGFDLWKIDANLRLEIVERIAERWRQQVATLSKSMQRSIGRRAHFSKTFMRCEVKPENVESWKFELAAVLEDPASFISVREESQ